VGSTMSGLGSRVGSTMQSMGTSITSLGTRMFGVGAAATAGFGVAVSAAVSFESAFAGVIKTVDATDEQLGIIRQTIRDMATDASNPVAGMENAHIVLANIMEAAGQLGVGADDLVEFTQVMGELGLATNVTAVEAATLTAQFANVTGMDFSNVRNFGSTIVALGNSSATTESAILSMASRIASAGAGAGLSEADILGFSAAMSSAGVTAELGGSNFSKFLGEIALASAEGGDELANFARVSSMSAGDFSTLWGTDATAAVQAFIGGLSGMDQAAQLMALEDLGLTGTEMTRVIMSLSGNTDLLTDSLNTAGTAWSENTALATEANARLATTEAQMNVTKNQIRDMAITVGSALLPAFNDILRGVRPIIESFANWAAENPELIQGAAMLAAGIAGLGAVMIPLGMAISAVGTVLGVLLSPIGLVVAAVAGLALAFSTNFLGIRDAVQPVVDFLGGVLNGIVGFIGGAVSAFQSGGFSGLGEFLRTSFTNAANAVGEAIGQIGAAISTYVSSGQLLNDAKALGSGIWDGIQAGIAIIGDIAAWVFTNVIQPMAAGIATYVNSGQLWTDLQALGTAVWDGILLGIQVYGEVVTWVFDNIIAPMAAGVANYANSGQLWDDLQTLGGAIWDGILLGLQAIGTVTLWVFHNFIQPMAAGVAHYVGSGQLFDDLVRLGGSLLDSVLQGIPEIAGWVNTNIVQPFIHALSGLGTSVVDAINNAIPNNISIDLGILGDVGIDIADNPLPGGSSGGGGGGGAGGGGAPAQIPAWAAGTNAGWGLQAQGHADGGRMMAGVPAYVGERGKELVTPMTDMMVTPNHELGGGSPSIGTVNVYANTYEGGQAAARGFREELAMRERASG